MAKSEADRIQMNLSETYFSHYAPLVREFVTEVDALELELHPHAPQPFLPLFGEAYERSSLRMAIVGQDTKYWGSLKSFIEQEKSAPGSALEVRMKEFRNLDFVGWGTNRYHFWGFAMMFLAALHGRQNWGVMKRKACREILSSFAWGNGNAVEYFGSSPKHMAWEDWEKVRKAGERFNGIRHLIATVAPKVIIVLWKDMPASYFAGHRYEELSRAEGIRHYRLPDDDVDVLHVPHPGRMRWESLSADDYSGKLIQRLQDGKHTVAFPHFVQEEGDGLSVIDYLVRTAPVRGPGFDKFQFVEWVAEELKKRESFMSAPSLAPMLNTLGYRTNYGSEYEGARGIYNLISGTYKRLDRAAKGARARMVAEAFRRPNFEYAYEV